MSDLAEFLLARIAEDEGVARSATPLRWDRTTDHFIVAGYGSPVDGEHLADCLINSEDAAHIARHDPARVLAECEAKRRIVAMHRGVGSWSLESQYTLRYIALPYADHPDYREEWKP